MACEIIDVEVKIKEIVKKTGMSKEIATELAHEFLAKETQKAQIDNMSGSIDIASEGNSGPIVPETAVQEPVINPVIEKNNSSLPDNMTSEKIIDPDEYFTLFNINKDEETEYSYDESDIEVLGRDYVRIKPEGWKFPVVFNMNTMKNKKGTWEVIATKNDLMSPPTKTVEVVVSEGNGWTESTVRDTGSKRYIKEFKDERYPNFDLLVQYDTETKLFSIIEVTTDMSLGAFASSRKVMYDQYKQKTTEGKITQEVLKEAVDKALEKQKKDAIPAQPLKILMSSIIMKNQTPDSLQKKIDTLTEPQLQRIKQILVSAIGKKTYQELSDWMDKAYNTGSKQSKPVAKTVLDKTFKFEGKPFKDIYDFAKRLPGILDKAYTGKVKDQRLDADNVVLNNMDWLTPELLLQIDMNKMQDGTTKTEILKHIENDKFETLEKSSPIDSFTLAKAMEFGRIFEGTFSGIPKEIFNKSLESITDLDDKLKFQKLYADDNPEPEYQHDTNMESILDNEEVFNRVLAKLQKLYPNITAKQIKSIQDTDGKKALGMALGMAIRYSSDAGIDTVPHEYAHIYINMLENTQYMDNVIKYIMKTKKINRADAKEFLAEKMGEDFSTREGGKKKDKYQNIIEKLWEYIRNVFKNVDPKDKKIMMDMINKVSENFHEGQNKESISLVPRDGFSRVDPETTFKTNKTGSEVLNKIQTVFPDSILTGSVALSSQGTVYRTGTGDLHDLDMIMPKGNYTEMKAKFLLEFEDATKIYDFYTKKKFINKIPVQKHIATYIVPPKNTVIADVRKHKGFYGKVEHYKIMEKTTNKIVGTYDAEIGYNNKGDSVILSEDFGSGEKAIIVDLMFQHDSLPARDNFLYHSKTLDRDVKMTTADSIFDAKKDIGDDSPRDKDIMDFNLFSKEKIIGDSEPVVTATQGSSLNTNSLFDTTQGDVEVTNENIDLSVNNQANNQSVLQSLFTKYENQDANEDGISMATVNTEFFNLQGQMLDGFDEAFSAGAKSNITLKEFETAVGSQRETAGSIEHKSDRTAGVNLRWNKEHGTARKSEVFMHEIVHFMTYRAFNVKPELKIILNALREEAIKSGVSSTIFLKDLQRSGTAITQSDVDIAQDKFDYVFGKYADPEEFFAYALTNEHVYSAIQDLKIDPKIIDQVEVLAGRKKGFINGMKKLLNALIMIVNKAWSAQAGAGGKTGAQIVTDTMTELVSLQALMDNEETKIQEALGEAEDFFEKADRKVVPFTTKFDKKLEEFSNSVAKSEKTSKIKERLKDTVLIGRLMQTRLVQDIVTNITQKTDNNKWSSLYELYRQGKNFTEKHRKGLSDAVEGYVGEYFEGIDDGTRKAISTIMFKLDIPSMIDTNNGIDLEDLKKMLYSEDNANKMYESYYNDLKSLYDAKSTTIEGRFGTDNNAEFESDMKHAIALGQGLIDGGVHIGNQQMNADNIYNKYYLSGSNNYENKINHNRQITPEDRKIISALNKVISSYAIKESSQIDKTLVYEYLKNDSNISNIKAMISMYKEYITDSIEDLYINNFNPVPKGFFEQQNEAKMSYDIVQEDQLSYYTGKFGNMIEIEAYGEINGIKYYEVAGRDHSVGFSEGMFSISGNTISGISLKSILTEQISTDNKKLRKNQRISTERINNLVEEQILQMAENGGVSNIVSGLDDQQFLPEYDAIGNIIDYKMNPTLQKKIKYMKADTDVVKSAAFTFSKMQHRLASNIHNREAVDELLQYNEDNNDDDFTVLEKHVQGKFDEDIHGRWNRLPEATRNYIYNKTGSHSIAIPTNMLTTITGEKNVSMSNFNFGPVDIRNNKKTQKMILAFEDYIAEMWGWVKETIAIRMGAVVAANAISNMTQAWVYGGIDPLTFMKMSRRKWSELNEYNDLLRDLEMKKVELAGQGDNKSRKTLNEIRILETRIEKNHFHLLVQDGQFSPIVEDVNTGEKVEGHIAKMIDEAFNKNKFTQAVKPIKEVVFMDRNTVAYKAMMKITQYGDIITRDVMLEHAEQKAIAKGKPFTEEDRQNYMNFLDQLFVNYSYIDNRFIRYAERIYGVMFTKYLFRQAKAMHSVAVKSPARLATFLSGEQLSGIDITTADDDYWKFSDALLSRMSMKNPIDMLIGDDIPILGVIPGIGDVIK